jgi:gentisate 1,2-dioxygenase
MTVSHKDFYDGLEELQVAPLWRSLGSLLLPEPRTSAVPHVWRYADVRPALMEAGEAVTAEEAERRVLMLLNPGLDGKAAATNLLYAGLQLVLPGEIAGPHRHSQAALRFIVEGSGGYTTVDGERSIMRAGDMLLTPSMSAHDHGNESDEPMIWLDGLDVPIVNPLEATFFEDLGDEPQAVTEPSPRAPAGGRLNPPGGWTEPFSPIVNYPWERTEEALRGAARTTPTDGVILEYTNPFTGGPVLPTMGCSVQLLPAGTHTEAHRHTSSGVYHAVRGSGTTIVDGRRLEWEERDTFAVPTWAVHEHVNDSGDEAILFSFTDEPVLRALGLHREVEMPRQG